MTSRPHDPPPLNALGATITATLVAIALAGELWDQLAPTIGGLRAGYWIARGLRAVRLA